MMILSDLRFFLPCERRGVRAVVLTMLLMGGLAAVAAHAFATN
jgi:hypothetical protein